MGRVLQPWEEVGRGPVVPPGSICGSQAMAESQLDFYFPFLQLRFILGQPAQQH